MSKDLRRIAAVGVAALLVSAMPVGTAYAAIRIVNLAPSFASSGKIPDVLRHEPAPSLLSPIPAATKYHGAVRRISAPPSAIHVVPTPYRAHKVATPGEVESLQRSLDEHGADLRVDGVMGQRTNTALLNYQSDHGLAITSRLDRETKNTLHIG